VRATARIHVCQLKFQLACAPSPQVSPVQKSFSPHVASLGLKLAESVVSTIQVPSPNVDIPPPPPFSSSPSRRFAPVSYPRRNVLPPFLPPIPQHATRDNVLQGQVDKLFTELESKTGIRPYTLRSPFPHCATFPSIEIPRRRW
jgi:hypothetical protein